MNPAPSPPAHRATAFRLRASLAVPALHGCLAGLVAAGGALLLPNRYRSEVRILSDAGHAGGGSLQRTGVWAPTAPPETFGSREDGPTVIYADILRSRRLAEQLLLQSYDYRWRRFGRPRQARGTLMAYLGATQLDRAVGPLHRLLTVQRDAKSGQLTIAAETRSPDLSQQVARKAAEVLKDVLVDLSQMGGRNKARFTLDRLEEVRATYAGLSRDFLAFQEGNRDWESSPSPAVRFRGARLKEQMDLWRQVVTNLTLNHEQALLEAQNDTQTLLLLDPGHLPVEKSGPARALMVFTAAAAVGAGSWAARNRGAIANRIFAKEPSA
jgi:uncharacterized protein involved in exopolysaccharide biosynthesis